VRVLLLDNSQYFPASPLFADCLGPNDHFFDEAAFIAKFDHSRGQRVLFAFIQSAIVWDLNRAFLETAVRHRPEVVLVVKGTYLSPSTLAQIKGRTGATLVCFATDDLRNRRTVPQRVRMAAAEYDLYCTVRRAMLPEMARTEFVMCGYRPSVHYPPLERIEPAFDVALIGGADADRVPYARALAELADPLGAQVNVGLFGGYWDRVPELRWLACGVASGSRYRETLWRSKIAIALVRRANRDDHTLKTFELPACRVFTLFEDTDTHRVLFGALGEDIFFRTPEDLVHRVRSWLGRPTQRERMAWAEWTVVTKGKHTWKDRYDQILGMVEQVRAGTRGITV